VLGIDEMKMMRTLIRKNIGHTRNEVVGWEVTMMPLVERMEAEEIGDRARGGGIPFLLPINGGRIVGQIVNVVRVDVEHLGQNIELSNGGCQLGTSVETSF
jgi:hypothetical protein